MDKLYDQIDWVNDTTPALNETNLNLMSQAINDIDDRVIEIAGSVTEASTYATAAAGSASEAATYANNASNYATNASSSATTANSNMLTSEGYALGTQNGVAVSSDSQYYENNAKYYSEHAFSTTPEGYEALVNKVDNILDMIADEWSSTKTYSYGMWLHYDGILYKVIASNTIFSAVTPPNTSYYEEVSITDAIQELNSYIGNRYNSGATYDVGDIISHNGYMYVVNVSCTGIEPPNTNYYTKTTLASLIASNASNISTLNSSLTYSSYTDFTVNSDYLSSGYYSIVVYKNSYMCWITLNFSPSQSVPSATILIENLPKPISKVYFDITDGNNNARRLMMTTDGAVVVDGNSLSNYWHNATIMYPI